MLVVWGLWILLLFKSGFKVLFVSKEIKATRCVLCEHTVCYTCVWICEWNLSHVSPGSEGQTLQENPHIPHRHTSLMDARVSISN